MGVHRTAEDAAFDGDSAASPDARPADRWITTAEVTAVALLLAAQIWLVWEWAPMSKSAEHAVRITLIVLLIAVLVASFARMRDSRAELGLTAESLRHGWASAAIFTVASLAALAVGAMAMGISAGDINFEWLLTYTHGILGQQIALQWFLNNRVYRALGNVREPKRTWWTVIVCVIVFTLLHAPNPGLMVSVIPASAFWCWHFRKFRNLPALLLSHLILGSAAMVTMGDGPLLRLRVGPPAWRMLMSEQGPQHE